MQEELNAIDSVSRALDRITRIGRFAEFTLSNGIVLKMKPVPPVLLQAVTNEFQPPPIPKVHIEEDDRWEENPSDPSYIEELGKIAEAQNKALADLVMAVGSEVVSVPEGYERPEDDGWIEHVKFAAELTGTKLEIDTENTTKRYLYWLRFYALETGGDVALAQNLPYQLSGIREGEVEEVIESFRGLPPRGADNVRSITSGS